MLLKFLRKKKNMKRIIWGLAILIIPAFVIWGAGSSGKKNKTGPSYAGKIFNRKVSFDEYLDMWRVARDHVTRSFGANIPPEFIDQLTWNRILLLEEAKRKNIVVKDSEVVEKLASFPIFQKDGIFDRRLYKSILGDSMKNFEEKLRDDLRISKLTEKVTSKVSVTDEEIKNSYKKRFEKIKASYISIPFSDFEKEVRYQEDDLIKLYKNNKNIFRKPEQINVKYIEILFSRFDKDLDIREDEIERYFEEHLLDFKKPDSDETPILSDEIKKEISKKLGIERKESLAEEEAYKVLDVVLNKKDIEETAHLFSLDTNQTGFFSMQEEIPGIGWSYEFTKKGFELAPGEISNALLKTDKGFYIMQLEGKKASFLPEFTDVKARVIELYIKNQSINLSEKKAKKLYLKIGYNRKTGTVFEDIVKKIGLEVKQTDFITQDGYIPTLGPARSFVERCVSLKTGEISGPVKMLDSWVILKLDEYQGIDEMKFIEEKEIFGENLLSQKKESEFNKWFEKLKKDAQFVSFTLE